MDSKKLIEETLKELSSLNIKDIPNLDLYMDQVTTYLNKKFDVTKRNEEDKLITKTMINNYTKGKLLPPPEKKKYSKNHLLALFLILFYKSALPISDVSKIMAPIIENNFFDGNSLEELIENFINHLKDSNINDLLLQEIDGTEKIFINTYKDDEECAKTLGIINILCYDIFVRKILIEQLIDSLPTSSEEQKK